jgi:hypothetical protein
MSGFHCSAFAKPIVVESSYSSENGEESLLIPQSMILKSHKGLPNLSKDPKLISRKASPILPGRGAQLGVRKVSVIDRYDQE